MNPERNKQERVLPIDPFYTTRRLHSQLVLKQEQLETKMVTYYPLEYQQAAHGDWRENSPKDTLDNEWSLDTTQLNKLHEQLARSVVIEDLDIETHEVVPGAQVVLVNPHDKSEISLTMVSFTDLKEGYLSIHSEAGRKLMGKMRADQVTLQRGGIDYFILDIRKPDPTLPVDTLENPEPEEERSQVQPTQTKTGVHAEETVVKPKKIPSQKVVTQEAPAAQVTQSPFKKAIVPQGSGKEIATRPLVHRDEERFNSVKTRIVKMGGRITNETQSSRDLDQGRRETRSAFEFIVGGNRYKAELVARPKIISTKYQHTKRQGTSADVIHTYGDEEIKTMYVYKLDGRNWVLVDFK